MRCSTSEGATATWRSGGRPPGTASPCWRSTRPRPSGRGRDWARSASCSTMGSRVCSCAGPSVWGVLSCREFGVVKEGRHGQVPNAAAPFRCGTATPPGIRTRLRSRNAMLAGWKFPASTAPDSPVASRCASDWCQQAFDRRVRRAPTAEWMSFLGRSRRRGSFESFLTTMFSLSAATNL